MQRTTLALTAALLFALAYSVTAMHHEEGSATQPATQAATQPTTQPTTQAEAHGHAAMMASIISSSSALCLSGRASVT